MFETGRSRWDARCQGRRGHGPSSLPESEPPAQSLVRISMRNPYRCTPSLVMMITPPVESILSHGAETLCDLRIGRLQMSRKIQDRRSAMSRPLTARQSLFRPVANNALNSHRVCTIIEVLASFVNTHMHLHMQPLRWMSGWCATKIFPTLGVGSICGVLSQSFESCEEKRLHYYESAKQGGGGCRSVPQTSRASICDPISISKLLMYAPKTDFPTPLPLISIWLLLRLPHQTDSCCNPILKLSIKHPWESLIKFSSSSPKYPDAIASSSSMIWR